MPLKFTTTERCTEDDCGARQPTDRSPQYRYEAPTGCQTCYSWHDEFYTTLARVKIRRGFRWNGGYEKPGKFD